MTTDLKTVPYYFTNSGTARRMGALNDVYQNDLIAEAFYSWDKIGDAYHQLAVNTVTSFGKSLKHVRDYERPNEYIVSVTTTMNGTPVITKWIEHQGDFYNKRETTLQAFSFEDVQSRLAAVQINGVHYIAREQDSFFPQLYVAKLLTEGIMKLAKTRQRLQNKFNAASKVELYENIFDVNIFLNAVAGVIMEWNEDEDVQLRIRPVQNGFVIEQTDVPLTSMRLLEVGISRYDGLGFTHEALTREPVSLRPKFTSPTEVALVQMSTGITFMLFAQTSAVDSDGRNEIQPTFNIRLFDMLTRTMTNPIELPTSSFYSEKDFLRVLQQHSVVMTAKEVVLELQ